jgi:hypothetical protein
MSLFLGIEISATLLYITTDILDPDGTCTYYERLKSYLFMEELGITKEYYYIVIQPILKINKCTIRAHSI